MTRVLVCGAAGRMGDHVVGAVREAPDLTLAAALEAPGSPRIGDEIAPGVTIVDDPAGALDGVDVAVDFSLPSGTLALLAEAAPRGTALVIATTGFDDCGLARIREAAGKVAVVMAPNYSLGINVMLALVAEAARRLRAYDLEVLEMHHSRKVDAPSGTALRIAEAAAAARGLDLAEQAVYHRQGHTGPRRPDAIGLQTLRAGDSVGEHTVYLAGPGERLEISHRALSRDNFAAGALRAARWVVGRAPGLYSMQDVLAD
jgi:4-hydroxy-tetrahydrodipicolinate reductase